MAKNFSPITGLNLWPGETCLLSELSNELSKFGSEYFSSITIVVPTQRLGLNLIEKLARKNEHFIPPRILNFEQFVESSIPEDSFNKNLISDLSFELIVGSLLKEKKYKHLFVGDELGFIKIWNLTPILKELGIQPCKGMTNGGKTAFNPYR